jgi:hypothetical protein
MVPSLAGGDNPDENGAYCDRNNKEIVLGNGYEDTGVLAHEVGHARSPRNLDRKFEVDARHRLGDGHHPCLDLRGVALPRS